MVGSGCLTEIAIYAIVSWREGNIACEKNLEHDISQINVILFTYFYKNGMNLGICSNICSNSEADLS